MRALQEVAVAVEAERQVLRMPEVVEERELQQAEEVEELECQRTEVAERQEQHWEEVVEQQEVVRRRPTVVQAMPGSMHFPSPSQTMGGVEPLYRTRWRPVVLRYHLADGLRHHHRHCCWNHRPSPNCRSSRSPHVYVCRR